MRGRMFAIQGCVCSGVLRQLTAYNSRMKAPVVTMLRLFYSGVMLHAIRYRFQLPVGWISGLKTVYKDRFIKARFSQAMKRKRPERQENKPPPVIGKRSDRTESVPFFLANIHHIIPGFNVGISIHAGRNKTWGSDYR